MSCKPGSSRTAPSITKPRTPLRRASTAISWPSSAASWWPPPSTTRTSPSRASASAVSRVRNRPEEQHRASDADQPGGEHHRLDAGRHRPEAAQGVRQDSGRDPRDATERIAQHALGHARPPARPGPQLDGRDGQDMSAPDCTGINVCSRVPAPDCRGTAPGTLSSTRGTVREWRARKLACCAHGRTCSQTNIGAHACQFGQVSNVGAAFAVQNGRPEFVDSGHPGRVPY